MKKRFLLLAGIFAVIAVLAGCDFLDEEEENENEATYTIYTATTTISEYNTKILGNNASLSLESQTYNYFIKGDSYATDSALVKSSFTWTTQSWSKSKIRTNLSDMGISEDRISEFISGSIYGFAIGQSSGSANLVFRFSDTTVTTETKVYLTISVKDSSTNGSISNATVEIRNSAGSTLNTFNTDSSGTLSLSFPASDAVYTLIIKKDGYGQKTKTITVFNGKISDGNISISLVNISKYDNGTATSFSSLADDTGGITTYSVGPTDLTDCIETVFGQLVGGSAAELVLAIDATGSMSNDIAQLRKDLIPAVREVAKKFTTFRVGLVFYRDDASFNGSDVYRFDFTANLTTFETNLNKFTITGGRGEGAVYEALYSSMTSYNWTSSQRRIVLIGDAPPKKNSTYSRETIVQMATQKNLPIDVIILPS